MLEFASFIASAAAVIWARKLDIHRSLGDPASRIQIAERISSPIYKYSLYLSKIGRILDHYMESIVLSVFFCLMLALAYSSVSFLFSLAVSGSEYKILPGVAIPGWQAKLLFLSIVVVAILNFLWARAFSKPQHGSPSHVSHWQDRLLVFYHLAGALWLSLSIYLIFRSGFLLSLALIVSVGAALTQKTWRTNEEIITKHPISMFFSASLGCFAMLIVLFYFLSSNVTRPLIYLIYAVTLTSGVITVAARPYTTVGPHRSYVKGAGPVRSLISRLGRPSLYVAFYCSRASGSFCFAVSNILWVSKLLQNTLPEPVVVSSSIVLMSSVYFAGAKSIIGAGVFAFFNTALVSVFTFVFYKELFFEKWSYLFLFWIILPFSNAFFDWIRLNVLRLVISKANITAVKYSVSLIIVDLLFGVLCILMFSAIVVSAVSHFNDFAVGYGYSEPIPIKEIIDGIHRNEEGGGLWFILVASTIMFPTLITFTIYLAAGIITTVPRSVRESLASQALSDRLTDNDRDLLAWKIAAIESLSGVIFFVVSLVVVGRVVMWEGESFGELLYRLAYMFIH